MTLVIADIGGTSPALVQSALNKIPSPRREEICALKDARAQAQRVAGEALVRLYAFEKFGLSHPLFLRGEKGKPYLKEAPSFCFNLSHSGEAVVFAAAGMPVGVDVEEVVPREFSAVAARCFSEEEQKKIAASAAPLIEFYRIWTTRESIVKRRGEGIAAIRNLSSEGERVRSYAIAEGKLFPCGECGAPRYLLSVCTSEGENSDMSVHFCSAEQVLRALK